MRDSLQKIQRAKKQLIKATSLSLLCSLLSRYAPCKTKGGQNLFCHKMWSQKQHKGFPFAHGVLVSVQAWSWVPVPWFYVHANSNSEAVACYCYCLWPLRSADGWDRWLVKPSCQDVRMWITPLSKLKTPQLPNRCFTSSQVDHWQSSFPKKLTATASGAWQLSPNNLTTLPAWSGSSLSWSTSVSYVVSTCSSSPRHGPHRMEPTQGKGPGWRGRFVAQRENNNVFLGFGVLCGGRSQRPKLVLLIWGCSTFFWSSTLLGCKISRSE